MTQLTIDEVSIQICGVSIGVTQVEGALTLLRLLSPIRVHTWENQYPALVDQLEKRNQDSLYY